MSKIIAKNDLADLGWEVSIYNLSSDYADLYFQFTSNRFNDLKFRYELLQNNNIKKYGVFPPPGVRYVSSDQEYLVVERLFFHMETKYQLYLCAENNKKIFEKTINFTTPRPVQPYSSWIWNDTDKVWESPIEYPSDDGDYRWSEDTQSWDPIDNS